MTSVLRHGRHGSPHRATNGWRGRARFVPPTRRHCESPLRTGVVRVTTPELRSDVPGRGNLAGVLALGCVGRCSMWRTTDPDPSHRAAAGWGRVALVVRMPVLEHGVRRGGPVGTSTCAGRSGCVAVGRVRDGRCRFRHAFVSAPRGFCRRIATRSAANDTADDAGDHRTPARTHHHDEHHHDKHHHDNNDHGARATASPDSVRRVHVVDAGASVGYAHRQWTRRCGWTVG